VGVETVAMILAAAGSSTQVISQVAAGKRARGTAEYNAAIAEQNARIAELQADIQEGAFRRKGARLQAEQRAETASKGLLPVGTPLAIMVETASELEKDAQFIQYGGSLRSRDFNLQARAYRRQGRDAERAAIMKAIGTGFLAAGQLGLMSNKYGGSGAGDAFEAGSTPYSGVASPQYLSPDRQRQLGVFQLEGQGISLYAA
jgi:hypothetical protein